MATAKVIIAGQNNIGPAVKSAQGDIIPLSNVAQKAGETLKSAFTVTAIAGGVFDQPYMTMQVLKVIQVEYRKNLKERNAKNKN